MTFHRQGNERIDDLLTRFDIIRTRAQQAGQLAIGYEGLSFLLLRAAGVSQQQLMMILQHYNMAYPTTPQQMAHMQNQLRRMGHMIERSPNNLASAVN